MLEIKNLNVRYLTRADPAVSNVSMKIGRNEFMILAGESASGKSTVMQSVCGFIPHIIPAEVSGSVMIEGKENLEPSDLARTVSMVQQDPESQFCTETVEEEVAFGPENFCYPEKAIDKAVAESLADVNASHLRYRELASLSGGEKQKIAIASMLVLKPKILILDEPTSNLDPLSIKEVLSAISQLRAKKRNLSIIVIEHRVKDFLKLASKLVYIKDGKVEMDDSPREIMKTSLNLKRWMLGKINYPNGTRKVRRSNKIVSVRGLNYRVNGSKILDDINFDVDEGAIVALMGRNGAGKTTLLRHIAGLQKPQRGKINVLSHKITQEQTVEPWTLGRDVGLVFQNPNHQIFENTIDKELLFGPRNFNANIAEAETGVREFEDSEGITRDIHPQSLSFGQKRRLNINSASLHGPKLILLDEPFAGQDATNSVKISKLISKYQKRGRTFIIVTHDPHFARSFCTDILTLDDGRIIGYEKTGNVMKDRNIQEVISK